MQKRHPGHSNGKCLRAGFTMLELMIVIVIAAVLASLALASYQRYVIKARRADGKEALIKLALDQERFRSNCPSYATSITNPLPTPPTPVTCAGMVGLGHATALSTEGFYTLSLSNVTAVNFTLTATAVAGKSQTKDSGCTALTFTKAGTKTPANCW